MADLILLGDSVIDNAAYVEPGEPDVPAQVRARLPGVPVESRAVDGQTAADILAAAVREPLPPGVPVVLSAGGNDALGNADLLRDPASLPFAAAMLRLYAVREAFRPRYTALLDALAGRPLLVATIYDLNDADPSAQAAASGALSAFNDVIQREAAARGAAVLELRDLFTAPEHYANPIEPSAAGGERIAAAIAAWHRALSASPQAAAP